MEELFNILSASARLRKPKRQHNTIEKVRHVNDPSTDRSAAAAAAAAASDNTAITQQRPVASRDRTGKRDVSASKLESIHEEKMAAFRNAMHIHVKNKKIDVPDPMASFADLNVSDHLQPTYRTVLRNVEGGKWKEPTPVQMQTIPALVARRDVIAAAPTGSGKSGAFILPSLLLTATRWEDFYASQQRQQQQANAPPKSNQQTHRQQQQGEIRGLLLAPSFELAGQLHREVERLARHLPLRSLLLQKSNAAQVVNGSAGGNKGLDILVTTPMRLVDCMEKGLRLNAVRIVVLDEADRLLDASDGKTGERTRTKSTGSLEEEEDEEEDVFPGTSRTSGSGQSKTFLAQMDAILAEIPPTAVRGLFSATITPSVKVLAESILRNPIDIEIQASEGPGGANPDIEQELFFVGREEGKLLAIRQLVLRGQLCPPVMVFLQSQERAQALFGELLYDGIHVDVIHSGRSKAARENAVAKFRRGDTWVLIATDLVARGVDFRAVNMVINYDLPESGISYIHRIGRTGRAGRKGKAITLFTEADFENLRVIANIMKQSGCKVEDWMLQLSKSRKKNKPPKRSSIDTTPRYDKAKKSRKEQIIRQGKRKKAESTA